MNPRRTSTAAVRRVALRDSLWSDAAEVVWNRQAEIGFFTLPRTLPLIGTLIKILGDRVDASRVYFDLWSRAFDEGLVEIDDPEAFAASVGYSKGPRSLRTWRSCIAMLRDLGFVRVRPKGTREYGYVLLLHPHDVVQELLEQRSDDIPEWWVSLFRGRIIQIGAVLRTEAK